MAFVTFGLEWGRVFLFAIAKSCVVCLEVPRFPRLNFEHATRTLRNVNKRTCQERSPIYTQQVCKYANVGGIFNI